jgi:hypothetical protein
LEAVQISKLISGEPTIASKNHGAYRSQWRDFGKDSIAAIDRTQQRILDQASDGQIAKQ